MKNFNEEFFEKLFNGIPGPQSQFPSDSMFLFIDNQGDSLPDLEELIKEKEDISRKITFLRILFSSTTDKFQRSIISSMIGDYKGFLEDMDSLIKETVIAMKR